jgi:hypothetical protein
MLAAPVQYTAQRNRQRLVEVMQTDIPGSQNVQLHPARVKLFQIDVLRCANIHQTVESILFALGGAPDPVVRGFQVRFSCVHAA